MSTTPPFSDDLPPFPNVLPPGGLEHELIRWYHQVHWAHRHRLLDGLPYKTLSRYIARTYQSENFNIFLVPLTLEDREIVFRFRYEVFLDIYSKQKHPSIVGETLDELLEVCDMSKLIYLRLVELHEDRMPIEMSMAHRLTWDPALVNLNDISLPPAISGPPGSGASSDISGPHSTPDPLPVHISALAAHQIALNTTLANKKVAQLIGAFAERTNWHTTFFEEKIKIDEKKFRDAHIAEVQRHAQAMNRLVRQRKRALRAQEVARAQDREHDTVMFHALVELMDQLDTACTPPSPL